MNSKERIADYWNWRSTTYHEEFSCVARDERMVWKKILSDYIPENKIIRIAEIGTGPGLIAHALSEMGHQLTGVDLSEEMIKKASLRVEEPGINAEFIQGDAEDISLESERYDMVISKYLMWTLPHPSRFLNECHRILLPGGALILIDGEWFNNTDRKPEYNSKKYFDECYLGIKEALPLYIGNTADKVTGIVKDHGFPDASQESLQEYYEFLRNHVDPEKFAVTYPQPPYIISARKPC